MLKYLLVLLTLTTFVLFKDINLIYAQDSFDQVQSVSGNGISVGPIRVQRNYKVNDQDLITFTLLNNESTEQKVSVTVKSFKLINNAQDIVFDENIDDTVLEWIRNFQNRLVLQPKEKTDYKLELNITPETLPGGYLFGIFFESVGANSESSDSSNTVIRQRIGVPIIVNIAGVAGVTYGDVVLDTFDARYSLLSNLIRVNITILNNSNQIITPVGAVTVKKIWGIGADEIVNNFNARGLIINSFSIRSFDRDINFNEFTLGAFKVKLDFLYGLENNVGSKSVDIFVFPLWFIIALLILIVLTYRHIKYVIKKK